MKMKKLAIIGIVVLIVLSTVTCDILEGLQPKDDDDEVLVYTNVEYSKGGKEVTVWFNEYPVPVTKKSMRAMSVDLAEMAYDFLEVVFATPANGIARTSWELGESAGISGVFRPFDYSGVMNACMFAGKSSGKTLLGVGGIKEYRVGSAAAVSGGNIPGNVSSVTFQLAAVTTGLKTSDDSVYPERADVVDSFTGFQMTVPPPPPAVPLISSSILALGNSKTPFPLYTMDTVSVDTSITATYKFFLSGGATGADFWPAIRTWAGTPATYSPAYVAATADAIKVQKREPRFVDNGTYRQPKDRTDTKTRVVTTTVTTAGPFPVTGTGAATAGTIALTFNIKPASSGLFSFMLEIPVYMVTDTPADRSGNLDAIRWYLRTGYGPDLYNLDDGLSAGGCVLMGVGASQSDWIDIIWEWMY
jgi:hypothetical protein